MHPLHQQQWISSRRQFFGRASGIGAAALASLFDSGTSAGGTKLVSRQPRPALFAPTAKRVIYLFQSGAPAQLDLFDYKPRLRELQSTELPDSIRRGQRLTGFTANKSLPVAASKYKFSQHGQSGAWISSLLPNMAHVADEICFVKSMHTNAINHDPGVTFMQTGTESAGRPSIGAWVSYGLGSENADLPAFVAISSVGTGRPNGEPLYQRLWGSGFLPSEYQGVKLRSSGDPVLFLSNPGGVNDRLRRRMLDDVSALNQLNLDRFFDPEIAARIAQYELAYRMQTSVPDLLDFSDEPQHTFDLYGPESHKRGTFAANCLLARRLVESGVRFIQLFHRGWDHHNDLPRQIEGQCYDIDQASTALILDLKQRGLLEDTLVVWGGEFGRTVYCQGKLTTENYGRDHHPRCFTVWLAGGGIQGGLTYGATDDFSYNVAQNPVEAFDLNATILHCLGIDHTRLTYRYQGREHRLTDVGGRVIQPILA
ncbi:MAG: sulfatase [Planctomycetaceae bacterium]|nr:sulfatase [Planctomycetaceae bacterium]MBP60186.1 sulfatase [Planctomycetaceae bacterium]